MELPQPNPLRFEPCPVSGEGVHFWLLSQANRCRLAGLAPGTVEVLLRDATRGCGRPVPDREIAAAVRKAFQSDWKPGTAPQGTSPHPVRKEPRRWPEPDPHRIEEIAREGGGLADLWESSPIRFDDDTSHTEDIIDALFPGDPLLCCARSVPADARTMPRSMWRGHLEHCALMVPSPMSALTGRAQDGHESVRCLDNTGPRRFLVIEFDSGDSDTQAARLLHLLRTAPLALAVHSGGKSIHGWFYCAGMSDEVLRNFMARAICLGADPATWNRCQLVRCPDGRRASGQPQRIFYFNPSTLR
jgi:hypothetical protein